MEATSYRAFGIDFTEEDMVSFMKNFRYAYEVLSKEDQRWNSVYYCQKQIRQLFGSIMNYLNDYGLNGLTDGRIIRKRFVTDKENVSFMATLSKMEWNWLMERFARTEIRIGQSFEIGYFDREGRRKVAHGEWRRFLNRMRNSFQNLRSYSERIENELSKFVEWIKMNTRPLVNCIMLGGVVATVMFANVWATSGGNPLLVILGLSISIICLVTSFVSTAGDINSSLERIRQYTGIALG